MFCINPILAMISQNRLFIELYHTIEDLKTLDEYFAVLNGKTS